MLAITPKKDEYRGREGKSRWLREKAFPVHEDDVARWLSRVQNAARDEEISVVCAIEVGNMTLFIKFSQGYPHLYRWGRNWVK